MGNCLGSMSTIFVQREDNKEDPQLVNSHSKPESMPSQAKEETTTNSLPNTNSTAVTATLQAIEKSATKPTSPQDNPNKKQKTAASFAVHNTTKSDVTSIKASQEAVESLRKYLPDPKSNNPLRNEHFASVPLTAKDALEAQNILWKHHAQKLQVQRAQEIANHVVTHTRPNGTSITMKYFAKVYYPPKTKTDASDPPSNMPLFIGLHGGGGCPAKVNDGQWENHKKIYQKTYQELASTSLEPLLYIAPRAPTNNWNLWHEPHMDDLLDRLIANLAAAGRIDTNRVYLSGYSAGGDGLYMLSPRMADRWAATSMMAGHPNGVSLRGVYNLPFSLHVGGKDGAYKRNDVARTYKKNLESWLAQEKQRIEQTGASDDGGHYKHVWAKVYENKGHWLQDEESSFVPWMAKYERKTHPKTLVWDSGSSRQIDLTICPRPHDVGSLALRFSDEMIGEDQMEKPISVYVQDKEDESSRRLLTRAQPQRTIRTLHQTLQERGDPNTVYSAEITVDVGAALRSDNIENTEPKHLRGS